MLDAPLLRLDLGQGMLRPKNCRYDLRSTKTHNVNLELFCDNSSSALIVKTKLRSQLWWLTTDDDYTNAAVGLIAAQARWICGSRSGHAWPIRDLQDQIHPTNSPNPWLRATEMEISIIPLDTQLGKEFTFLKSQNLKSSQNISTNWLWVIRYLEHH